MIPHKQLTLADIFEDCKEIYESDKPQFLTLLENHIDLDEILPIFFVIITILTNRYDKSIFYLFKFPAFS